MLALYLGIYTFILAGVWGLFIVAKIHAFKFKNFSKDITKITNILIIFLLTLSILGYVVIILGGTSNNIVVEDYSSFDTKEVNY